MKLLMIAAIFMFVPMVSTAQVMAPLAQANSSGEPNIHSLHVCGASQHRLPSCAADVEMTSAGLPQATAAPSAGSLGPIQFHTAYGLPCTPGGAVKGVCPAPASFGGQTIAIVDAYADPNIESDLGVYDQQYGLPACTQKNGCLTIHNMCNLKGSNRSQCFTDQGWALEASMDVEVAHAICQTCKIIYVEASYGDWADMGAAENWAAQNGATEISNSWAGPEFSAETQYDSYWNHPGIAVAFASGDNNFGALYPATAPTVIAVGGTTLTLGANAQYGSETVWSSSANGTGSGCSLYEPTPSWQLAMPNWGATGCGATRASTDVSADADPKSGAAVYDSFGYNGTSGWYQLGGTSLATPIIASVVALGGGAAGYVNPAQLPYVKAYAANAHDVTVGSNGTCGTIMCSATAGYDGPTGLGTPNGVGGL